MKTKTVITEITHDDLVNLLSVATEGNNAFDIAIPAGFYKGTDLEDENDCREDKWAKVLLAGKTLLFYDFYAEDVDEFYGDLPNTFFGDFMQYEFTLDTIKEGLARALDSGTYIAKYVYDIYEDEGVNLDLPEADCLMQYIIFGEVIYG